MIYVASVAGWVALWWTITLLAEWMAVTHDRTAQNGAQRAWADLSELTASLAAIPVIVPILLAGLVYHCGRRLWA